MPLVFNRSGDDGATIGVWKITESADELLSMATLRQADWEKLQSFPRDQRKCEWLAVRVLAQQLLGYPPEIDYRHNGAPMLANSTLHIGITHTKGFAAVAVHPRTTVGIDIEYPSERILKITDRFMSDDELKSATTNEPVVYQTVCWCAKEALYKWWGRSDVLFKEELQLMPFEPIGPEFKVDAEVCRSGISQRVSLTGIATNEFILTFIDPVVPPC